MRCYIICLLIFVFGYTPFVLFPPSTPQLGAPELIPALVVLVDRCGAGLGSGLSRASPRNHLPSPRPEDFFKKHITENMSGGRKNTSLRPVVNASLLLLHCSSHCLSCIYLRESCKNFTLTTQVFHIHFLRKKTFF